MKLSKIFWACGVSTALMMQSCSLDEVNPGGFTLENLGTTPEGYETLLNQCFFGMERKFYNDIDFMRFMEGNTDLWTSMRNQKGSDSKFFKFYGGANP
ncbi:MAG: RagB/SusD family nutrient uptake outer membrane protein, partial [Duncaniella sp.]|nr:RagB/SusD family nutrient uptake outer membrane protein [Duncaniella sp.]